MLSGSQSVNLSNLTWDEVALGGLRCCPRLILRCRDVFALDFFGVLFFSPQPPERTQMFVTSRLLEMGFTMRHIYWAMEAAGTALCDSSLKE